MTMDSQSMVKSVLVGSTGFINKSLETISAVHSSQPDFDGHYTSVMCYHILLILRHVSLRMLYAFSGWQATQDQIDEAKEYLRAWMRENPSAARQCLWHAVRAFRTLRNKQHFACDDSFSLLLAALFMWAFDLLMPSSSYGAVSQEESQTVHKRPTRIDLLRDADEVKSWVEKGSHRTHITGIGILGSPGSSMRIMKECQRILLSSASWPRLRHGLACLLERVGEPHSWME